MEKKNENEKAVELKEEDLEKVAGGDDGYIPCPVCGNKLRRVFSFDKRETMCPNCGSFVKTW